MQITRATEYAVRCALHLALEPPGRVVPRREIAAARDVPEQFLGKIAQRLARAGIIRIHQGARGGYELVTPASRLTLLQVVEAAEGELTLNTCVMHPRSCSRTCVCAAHRVWTEARRQLRATLSGVTFAELAAQERPLPQLENAPFSGKSESKRRRDGAKGRSPSAERSEHDEKEVPASLLRPAIRSQAERDLEPPKQCVTIDRRANGRVQGGPQRQDPEATRSTKAPARTRNRRR